MRPFGAWLVGAIALLLVLSVSPSLRADPVPTPGPGVALVTDAVPLPPGAVPTALPPTSPVSLTLTLAYAHPAQLSSFLASVEDPYSPDYHHFLTATEFRSAFAPAPSEVTAAESALRQVGGSALSVTGDGATVVAVVPASGVETLLSVQLEEFGRNGATPLYTAVGTPELPASLRGIVTGVGGLSDASTPDLRLAATEAPVRPVAGPSAFVMNGSAQWLLGPDLTQAYGASDLFPGGLIGSAGGYPTHLAIATLLAGSYNLSAKIDLPAFDPNVVDTYFNNSSSPSWPRPTILGVPVTIDDISPPMPGSLGGWNDSTGDEFENSLDLEMAGSMAPGATVANFYFAGSVVVDATSYSELADDFAIDLNAALNYAFPSGVHLGVVSGSFGLPDLNDSAWNAALQEAAATGVTVVTASGDQGNAPDSDTGRGDGQWPVWPASAAFNTSGALSVGGVSLTLSGVPTTDFTGDELNVTWDSNVSGIAGMTAWWDGEGPPGNWAGTEGGLSTVLPEPAWQFHSAAQPAIAAAGDTQGASFLGRAGPDVAFPANDTLAYVEADAQGNLYFAILEGTSIAAPACAGLLADEISVLGSDLGFFDPELYRMASFFGAANGSSAAEDPFYDVTVGSNYVFSAGPGWDATTGWGGLAAVPLYHDLQNATITGYNYTGATPGLSAPSAPGFPLTVVLVIVGLALAAAVALVIAFGRPRRPAANATPPWGAGATYATPPTGSPTLPSSGPPGSVSGPPPAGATFLCPYCGSLRPAEPVRCPRCGAY